MTRPGVPVTAAVGTGGGRHIVGRCPWPHRRRDV